MASWLVSPLLLLFHHHVYSSHTIVTLTLLRQKSNHVTPLKTLQSPANEPIYNHCYYPDLISYHNPSDSFSFSHIDRVTVSQTLACSSFRDFPLANPFAWNTFPWDIWIACSVTILVSLSFSPRHSEILYILLLTFYYPCSHQHISSLRARNFICFIHEFSKCLEEWLAHILLNRYLSEWINEWIGK